MQQNKTQKKPENAPQRRQQARQNQPKQQNSRQKNAPSDRERQYLAKRAAEKRSREILGLIIIACGLFLALSHIESTGIIGKKITGFVAGLFGVLGVVVPYIIMAVGVYVIVMAAKGNFTPKVILMIGVAISIASLFHVSVAGGLGFQSYLGFVVNSFGLGEISKVGGGLFGSFFTYPSVVLLGNIGSYILFAVLLIAQSLILTNLSIRDATSTIAAAIKSNAQNIAIKAQEALEQRQARKTQQEEDREFDRQMREKEKYKNEKAKVSQREWARQEELNMESEISAPIDSANSKRINKLPENLNMDEPAFSEEEYYACVDYSQTKSDFNPFNKPRTFNSYDEFARNSTMPSTANVSASAIEAEQQAISRLIESQEELETAENEWSEENPDPSGDLKFEIYQDLDEQEQIASYDDEGFSEDDISISAMGATNGYSYEQELESIFGSQQPNIKSADEESDELSDKDITEIDFGKYQPFLPPVKGQVRSDGLNLIDFTQKPATNTQAAIIQAIPIAKKEPQTMNIAPHNPIENIQNIAEKAPEQRINIAAPVQAMAPKIEPRAAMQEKPKDKIIMEQYVPPNLEYLNYPPKNNGVMEDPSLKATKLEEVLASFGISAKVINICQGPVITRYELQPASGVRVNKITNLSDDIALNLAAPRVRIEAPIPGKAAVGIEIPNKKTAMVALRDLVESKEFANNNAKLAVALGKDIGGKMMYADLAKMPHLLIAGSTGSGKSVCINCIICSIIYHASPEDVQLIMVDPKVVELAAFNNIPHLLIPVVTEPKKAASALKWAVQEMVARYQRFAQKGARDLNRYNDITMEEGQDKTPQIVVIIDELADLMMVAPDDVEDAICRIAQMGRAAGIHLVVATQRPSSDIITGIIKANIPSRIAFAVASATDSRIILDTGGAEKLLGKGDMLFAPIGASQPIRIQGALVTDPEVEKIHDYFETHKLSPKTKIDENAVTNIPIGSTSASTSADGADEDELLPDAVELILANGQASISMIQRRFRVGYARAARLIDIMEQMGIVSGFEGSKPRKILIGRADYEQIFNKPPNIPPLGT